MLTMRPAVLRLLPLVAALAAWNLNSGAAAADERRYAVFPVLNLAGIDPAEADYLWDVLRGTVTRNNSELDAIIPRADLIKVLGKKAASCDESCALETGRRLRATHGVLAELRTVANQPRITVKLLDVGSRSMERLETAGATGVAELEGPLEQAVAALMIDPASGADVSVPAPAQPSVEYTTISIIARSTREIAPGEPPAEVDAEVIINGRLVGRTPYEDGLPEGMYRVEVRHGGEVRHAEVLTLAGKGERVIEVGFVLPMTADERRELAARREAEKTARIVEQRVARARELARYEAELAEARLKRRPYVVPGTLLVVAGLGMVPAGIGLEVAAKRENDLYSMNEDRWRRSTEQSDIDKYKERMDAAASTRDLNHALGITFLVVGSAALVTGSIVLWLMPEKPEPPGSALSVAPLVGPDLAGLALGGRF